MNSKKNNIWNSRKSWKLYQAFLKALHGENLNETEVYKFVKAMARKKCWNYNRPNDADDLIQEVLIALAKGQYKKGSSLKSYILTIMDHQITKWWEKTGKGKGNALDNIELEKINKQLAVEIERRICADVDLKKVLSKLPDLQSRILKVMLRYARENNKIPSVRKIMKVMNEDDPEHKDETRYGIATEIKRLEEHFDFRVRELD